jgi:hypothetical protein
MQIVDFVMLPQYWQRSFDSFRNFPLHLEPVLTRRIYTMSSFPPAASTLTLI